MELLQPGHGLIIWMTLSFGLVLLILGKFAWKPILKGLREREQSIDDALHAADKAREEMKLLKFDNEKLLKEDKEERDAILREARKVREKMLEEAKVKANNEANRILENARQAIVNEKMAAITELRNQIGQLSIEIAEKVLQMELSDEKKSKEVVKNMVDNIKLN